MSARLHHCGGQSPLAVSVQTYIHSSGRDARVHARAPFVKGCVAIGLDALLLRFAYELHHLRQVDPNRASLPCDDPSRPRRMLQRDGRIPLDHGGLAVWQRSQILLQSLHGRVLRVRWAQGDRSGVDSLTVRGGQASSWPHVMLWRLFAICCST